MREEEGEKIESCVQGAVMLLYAWQVARSPVKKKALTYSICKFTWCKYPHHEQFLAPNEIGKRFRESASMSR